jgi:hypothetical protein
MRNILSFYTNSFSVCETTRDQAGLELIGYKEVDFDGIGVYKEIWNKIQLQGLGLKGH